MAASPPKNRPSKESTSKAPSKAPSVADGFDGLRSDELQRERERELSAVLNAKGYVAAALTELSASIAKVQSELDSATSALQRDSNGRNTSRRGTEINVSGEILLQSLQLPSAGNLNLNMNVVPQTSNSVEDSGSAFNEDDDTLKMQMDGDWPTSLAFRLEDRRGERSGATGRPSQRSSDMSLEALESMASTRLRTLSTDSLAAAQVGRSIPCHVVHPNSVFFVVWNVTSVCLLVFDLAFIPLMLAWDIPLEGYLFYIACSTACFWTCDIALSFHTAYHHKGDVVTDLRSIRWRYLRTWFGADVTIVLCDWVSMLLATSTSWRVLRFAKAGRLLRLFVVARMLKVYHVMTEMIDDRFTGYAKLSFRFAKMFGFTLACAHLLSCMWFYIGREAPTDTGLRWINSSSLVDISHEDTSMWYQYFTSFHWAIAQICLGAIEVTSVTTIERMYNIVCLILGLLFGSMLVSSLSTAMFEVQMDLRESHLKMQVLKRFLREKEIDHKLALKVERQVSERLELKEKVMEKDVSGILLLSSSLHTKLRLDLFARYLKCHSLFSVCINVELPLVERICRFCLDYIQLRKQDDLFPAGKLAELTYFFISGALAYTQEPESAPVQETTVTQIGEGSSWISEAALWSRWIHVGSARAVLPSELAAVNVEKFAEALQRNSTGSQLMYNYGRQFHRRLQNARPPEASWPDDLKVPLTDWSDIVFSMDEWSQVIIGLDAIQSSASRSWKQASTLAKLTKEIHEGKSTVMLNAEGQIQRVVSVVALEIRNHAGQKLVQLGKSESAGRMKHGGKLPGAKQDHGELVRETVDRVLGSKMPTLASRLEVTGLKRDTHTKPSPEYGVSTKYLRCTTILSLAGEMTEEDALRIEPDAVDLEDDEELGGFSILDAVCSKKSNSTLEDCSAVTAAAMGRLQERDVFYFVDKKGTAELYAWFSEEEFQQITGSIGERLLPPWVSALGDRAAQLREERQAAEAAMPKREAPQEAADGDPEGAAMRACLSTGSASSGV